MQVYLDNVILFVVTVVYSKGFFKGECLSFIARIQVYKDRMLPKYDLMYSKTSSRPLTLLLRVTWSEDH